MKHRSHYFQIRHVGEVVEIWDGPPDHPESDLITAIHYTLVKTLIATLRLV